MSFYNLYNDELREYDKDSRIKDKVQWILLLDLKTEDLLSAMLLFDLNSSYKKKLENILKLDEITVSKLICCFTSKKKKNFLSVWDLYFPSTLIYITSSFLHIYICILWWANVCYYGSG